MNAKIALTEHDVFDAARTTARSPLTAFGFAAAPFLAALIVLLFGVITYAGARRERAAARLVARTHAVIEVNQHVLARLVDAETGERGFLISGDTAYLEPYRGAAAQVEAQLRSLRALTADNPRQGARLDTLEDLVRRRTALLGERIRTRQTTGFDRVRTEFITLGGGKPIMDSVRRVVAAIETEEQRLLATRSETQRAHERNILWIVGVGTTIAAAIALMISLMLSRFATLQTRLASEVRSRASELEFANGLLNNQAQEMELLNEELQTTNDELETRTSEAEEANRIKAEFLANMSHDLRTPLNAIVGYVDLLDAGVRGPITPEQRKDFQRIKRSAAHLLAIITEVLDFAKVEAGQVQMRLVDVSLPAVLSELEPLVEPQVNAKRLEFTTECDPTLVVRADREKLDQILVNLVGNAIKFTGPGGSVGLHCQGDGPWVRTEVRDTGAGIPADLLDAVFAPFVQGDRQSRPRDEYGVGLGLPISRHLARAMNGELSATSTVGIGSTFTLLLPRVSAIDS